MLSADGLIDGSYDITVHVTDIKVDKTIRVRGDVHIGGLMLRIVNSLNAGPFDWSDHAVWWPAKNTWLLRTRRTLDQYDVPAGAILWFTPMHRQMKVNFPDLQIIDVRINFSANIFNNIISICKEFGIRHPEELSLLRANDSRSNSKSYAARKRPQSYVAHPASFSNSNMSDTASIDSASADVILGRSMTNLFDANESCPTTSSGYGSRDQISTVGLTSVYCSPHLSARDAISRHVSYKPQTFVDKAKINARWLDSSLSLMEQGITDTDIIFLRFKYCTFFDLNPKYDAARINQMYQQARWSLISETVPCTNEEMILFAALQLHVKRHESESDFADCVQPSPDVALKNDASDDDVDAALSDLQMSLEGTKNQKQVENVEQYPQLKDYHMVLRPKKMSFNRFKKRFCIFNDTQLLIFKKADETVSPEMSLNVRGCVVRGEADVGANKFLIKLLTLSEQSNEILLEQDNMEKHATWLAAFQTAARRRTMADVTFTSELESVLNLLSLRKPSAMTSSSPNLSAVDIQLDDLNDYMCERVLKKIKRPQILKRMLEIAANLKGMTAIDAKLTFIRAWQNLPEAGFSYFIVNFRGSSKKDLIAVGVQRLLHLDINSGQCLRAWPYDKMRSWAVNWNTEQLKIELQDQVELEIVFNCVSANCKAVHEYIGGYVFLAMRSLNKNQTLDEKLFQKLTGGRD